MNRLILLVESRIRGDVYVRFGGELPKTHRSNTAGRWMLSLPLLAEDFLYDASFIKLKELSIGYNFPTKLLKKTPIQSLSVSFVARNLCYLLKHTPGTSPEGGYDTTMFSQAIDYAALPYTRTFGLSVSLGF